MAITIIVTNAGRAALVNAANTGTNAVTITQMGVTETAFVPNVAQVALPGEVKRIASVAGLVVADDVIHVTVSDTSNAAYSMRGLAFYLADGTLFALYGQAGPILNKTAESMMLLAIDAKFADIDAAMIEFGDTNFVLPPATTEILGLVELATTAEAQAGTDAQRVVTPLTGKQSVLGWLLSQDGSGSGLDADLLDGRQAYEFVLDSNFTGGAVLSRILTVDGSGSGLDADLLDGLHASAFATAGHTHGTMANQNANNVAITGGTIDGTPIGYATPSTGKFTSINATAGAMGDIARFSAAGSQALHVYADATVIGMFNVAGAGAGRDGFRILDGAVAVDIAAAELARFDGDGVLYAAGKSAFFFAKEYGMGTPDGDGLQLFCNAASALRLGGRAGNVFSEWAKLVGGNFGLGTHPAVRLHIKSAGETMRLETSDARGGGGNYVRFTDPVGTKAFLGFANGNNDFSVHNELGSIVFITNGATRLVIDTAGNVVPASDGGQILGWPTARWKEGHFADFVRIGGNNAWHSGNDGSGSGLDADMLDGLHAGAFVLDSNFVGGAVLSRLLTVDGSGSGLDADLLDGQHGAYYLPAGSYTAADVLAKLLGVDGAGSGLDADLLDGLHASALVKYTDFTGSNQNIGQPGLQRFPGGLMIQTGTYSVSANSTTTVTFGTSFNSICLACICSGGRLDFAAQDNNPFVSSYNIGGATIYSSSDGNASGSYIAVGF